jgi:hypothetical protein
MLVTTRFVGSLQHTPDALVAPQTSRLCVVIDAV